MRESKTLEASCKMKTEFAHACVRSKDFLCGEECNTAILRSARTIKEPFSLQRSTIKKTRLGHLPVVPCCRLTSRYVTGNTTTVSGIVGRAIIFVIARSGENLTIYKEIQEVVASRYRTTSKTKKASNGKVLHNFDQALRNAVLARYSPCELFNSGYSVRPARAQQNTHEFGLPADADF